MQHVPGWQHECRKFVDMYLRCRLQQQWQRQFPSLHPYVASKLHRAANVMRSHVSGWFWNTVQTIPSPSTSLRREHVQLGGRHLVPRLSHWQHQQRWGVNLRMLGRLCKCWHGRLAYVHW